MNDTALQVVEQHALVPYENPGAMMRQATDVAGVCREIVMRTACNIQGRKYVKCEGWMSIATAHGCIASSRSVERVEGGWTAIGEIRRMSDGVLLSQAEGFVGKDEKRWGQADEYACRAMAQTRAISRACRAAFAHVVVLIDGGLSTTPAEEVPDSGFENAKPVQHQKAEKFHVETPPLPIQPAAPVKVFKSASERKAWLDLHLEKCKLKLVSTMEITGVGVTKEFLEKKGHILPTETTADANTLTLFPSVPVEPEDGESDGDWKARVQEAVARDAKGIQRVFDAFARGDNIDQIPGAEVEAPEPRGPEPDIDPVPNGALHMLITVEHVSEKHGTSARGPWTRYGIKDQNQLWYNTFNKRIADKAKELKGCAATVFFTEGERGNDLHKIIPA